MNALILAADEKGKEAPVRCLGATALAVSNKPLPPGDVQRAADNNGRIGSKFVARAAPHARAGQLRQELQRLLALTAPRARKTAGAP